MARNKFRPSRKFVGTTIQAIALHSGGVWYRRVTDGENIPLAEGKVLDVQPGDMVRRADVRRGNCRVLVTITLPFREIAGCRMTRRFNATRMALRATAEKHLARDYQLIKTVGADGYPEWIATCMMMDRDAIAFRSDWIGDVKIDMGGI